MALFAYGDPGSVYGNWIHRSTVAFISKDLPASGRPNLYTTLCLQKRRLIVWNIQHMTPSLQFPELAIQVPFRPPVRYFQTKSFQHQATGVQGCSGRAWMEAALGSSGEYCLAQHK